MERTASMAGGYADLASAALCVLVRGEARMGVYSTAFVVRSSANVLALGVVLIVGTWRIWRALG